MTERLYYNDSYMKEFDATVVECKTDSGRFCVSLDRSAFYPTSGGQPYDTGTIGEAAVSDVFVDNVGEVWHAIDREIPVNAPVHCEIDWTRRFDHMQQHSGEHMIANAAWRIVGGETIGLHLGAEFSTIDMTLPNGADHIDAAAIKAIEDDVNERIQRNVPIKCWFPDKTTLEKLPLRKPPAVSENVRVVQIGDIEFCACGGTHPMSAGEIGLVKIIDARPSRGKLRVAFVCGKRAYELLRNHYDIAVESARILSTSVCNLPTLVGIMNEQQKNLSRENALLKREKALLGVNDLLSAACRAKEGFKIAAFESDVDMETARELASEIVKREPAVAVISVPAKGARAYILARSEGIPVDCGRVLSAAAKQIGGKGGGRADFAQGAGDPAMLSIMKDIIAAM